MAAFECQNKLLCDVPRMFLSISVLERSCTLGSLQGSECSWACLAVRLGCGQALKYFFAVTPPAMNSNVYGGKLAWHSMIRIATPGLRGAKVNPAGFPGDGIATLGPEVRHRIGSGLWCHGRTSDAGKQIPRNARSDSNAWIIKHALPVCGR